MGYVEEPSPKYKTRKYKKRKVKELSKLLKGNKDLYKILTISISNTQNGFGLGYQLLSRLSRQSASVHYATKSTMH